MQTAASSSPVVQSQASFALTRALTRAAEERDGARAELHAALAAYAADARARALTPDEFLALVTRSIGHVALRLDREWLADPDRYRALRDEVISTAVGEYRRSIARAD
ncbi:MAG TPA: hypothetical protein VFS05_06560 [Gemmatimonadaceae bacterium]|nr:hypothetical protein [Gemmatimonadaceae bacterium]